MVTTAAADAAAAGGMTNLLGRKADEKEQIVIVDDCPVERLPIAAIIDRRGG